MMGWMDLLKRQQKQFLNFTSMVKYWNNFNDDCNFPIDFGLNGNIYRLNSNADNMARSIVFTTQIY